MRIYIRRGQLKKAVKKKKEWPKCVEEAVERLMAELSEEDKKELKNTKKDLILHHFGLGEHIRNEFGLWQGNKELIASCCGEGYFQDPDEASSVIIRALWKRLQKS